MSHTSPIYKSDSAELLTEYEISCINGTTLHSAVAMYLGKYGNPGEVEKAGYAGGSFQTARRGAYGRPYSVRENYNSLFRASSFPRQPTTNSCPKRSNHAGRFSHALMRNYRCRDYREGRARLLFCGRARWLTLGGDEEIFKNLANAFPISAPAGIGLPSSLWETIFLHWHSQSDEMSDNKNQSTIR